MTSEKPPDSPLKYTVRKIALKNILKSNISYIPLNDFILRTHQLTIIAYQFIKAFLLFKHQNNHFFPIIDENFVLMAFKALYNSSGRGRKAEGSKASLLFEMFQFYDQYFRDLVPEKNKFDASKLSHVLKYTVISVLTSIKNNIQLHFIKRLEKFIKKSFPFEEIDRLSKEELDALSKEELKLRKTELKLRKTKLKLRKTEHFKELKLVIDDLINNTLLSSKKFHIWINYIRVSFLPKNTEKSIIENLEKNPHSYLKAMIKFNLIYETNGSKLFKAFPLRNEITPKYISIDTAVLVDLFVTENIGESYKNIEKMKILWSKFFNLKAKIFKQKNYVFDNFILTDGVSVSIRFLHNSHLNSEKNKKANKKIARTTAMKLYKTVTQEEKELLKSQKKEDKVTKKIKQKTNGKKNAKDKYKQMSEIEKNYKEEFPYFNLLNNEDTEYLKNNMNKIVYIDPGKRCIYYMMNDNEKYLRYTNKQRITESKRIRHRKTIENYKKKPENEIIQKLENELSNYNSMTCDFETFRKYVRKKNEVNAQLFTKYESVLFRKLRWHHYINKQRSESKLINNIEKHYGKNAILIIGDWSLKGKLKYMSTPGISLKRKIAKRFTVYSIDEFRTSCIEYKSERKCENMFLPDAKGKLREKHAILSYKNERNQEGYRNRDRNSVNGYKRIVNETLKTGERPEVYKRDYKLPEKLAIIERAIPPGKITLKKRNKSDQPAGQMVNGVKRGEENLLLHMQAKGSVLEKGTRKIFDFFCPNNF